MKSRSHVRSVLLVSAALASWSCDSGSSSSSPPPPPPPPTTGSLQLTNATAYFINEVYVSATTSATWGPIQNNSPIAPSSVWTLTGVPPGSYDGKAVIVGSVSRYNAYARSIPIVAGGTRAVTASTSAFTGSLRVVNGATSSIIGLYVVPPGAATWGSNQLSTAIPPSGVLILSDVPPGYWDVQCVHSDFTTNTGFSIPIASISYTTVSCP